MNYNTARFESDLKEFQVSLSSKQLNQFITYYEMLTEWNEKMNLTAIIDDYGIIVKHFVDCLECTKLIGKDINNLEGDLDISFAIKRYKGSLSSQPWYKAKTLNNTISTYEEFVQFYKGHDKDFDTWYQKLIKLRQRKQFYLCSKHLGHDGLSDFVKNAFGDEYSVWNIIRCSERT